MVISPCICSLMLLINLCVLVCLSLVVIVVVQPLFHVFFFVKYFLCFIPDPKLFQEIEMLFSCDNVRLLFIYPKH